MGHRFSEPLATGTMRAPTPPTAIALSIPCISIAYYQTVSLTTLPNKTFVIFKIFFIAKSCPQQWNTWLMYVNLTRNTQKLLSVICLKIERLKIREILKSHKNYKMSIGLNHSQSLLFFCATIKDKVQSV